MLSLEWNLDDALQARFEDGRDDGIESVALKMIRRGKSFEEIREDTDLPLERIRKLADTLDKNI